MKDKKKTMMNKKKKEKRCENKNGEYNKER